MSTPDYSTEPEKIWKASLLKHQNEAYYFLFFQTNMSKAWELLVGWIGTLNQASQKNLEDIVSELEAAIFNKQHIAPKRTYQIFREVSIHTYNNYLSQSGFGMVQTSMLPARKETPPAPAKKAYSDVSAKL